MSIFIKVRKINPGCTIPHSEIRLNINYIRRYCRSHANTTYIVLTENDSLDVIESPEEIDQLIEDAQFTKAIEQSLRGSNDS